MTDRRYEVQRRNRPKETKKGGIAQLARASALQAEGRRFDSDYLHILSSFMASNRPKFERNLKFVSRRDRGGRVRKEGVYLCK